MNCRAQYRNASDSTVQRPDWCKPYAYTPASLTASLYTHVNFAFAKVRTVHSRPAPPPVITNRIAAACIPAAFRLGAER